MHPEEKINLCCKWDWNPGPFDPQSSALTNRPPSTPIVSILFFFMSSLCLQCLYAGGRAYINAHFGVGSGSIFLDDVQCTSSSNQLLRCPTRKILSHNCHHSDDAGVGCEGMFHKKFYISCARNFCLPCLNIQPLVHLVSCDWQEVIYKMKAEWRSV